MKIGLAMSGGSTRGLAHIGVLKALHEEGIIPEVVTGTSMGSVIAGLYASGMPIDEIIELTYTINSKIFDLDWIEVVNGIIFKKIPKGFIKGNKVENLINKITNNMNIKDMSYKKLGIVATNLNGGQNIVFTNQQLDNCNDIHINDILLSKAIRASISLPLIFSPVQIDDMLLVDGGLVNNCPINIAQELGAEFIIASDITYNGNKHSQITNGIDVLGRTIGVFLKEANIDDYNSLQVPYHIMHFDDMDVDILKLTKENYDKIIQIGYDKTKYDITSQNLIKMM